MSRKIAARGENSFSERSGGGAGRLVDLWGEGIYTGSHVRGEGTAFGSGSGGRDDTARRRRRTLVVRRPGRFAGGARGGAGGLSGLPPADRAGRAEPRPAGEGRRLGPGPADVPGRPAGLRPLPRRVGGGAAGVAAA